MTPKTHTVIMRWNEATEQWRMLLHGFTVQEHRGIFAIPRYFFNCLSINMMFPNLDKNNDKKYKITVEEIEE